MSLTLGGAARLAARQGALAAIGRERAAEASARVRQRRADLLPSLSALAGEGARTFNTASLGIDFPTAPGQRPFFDPDGQVEGPVKTFDFRGRIQTAIVDPAAIVRYRSAQSSARASEADAANAADQAAQQGAAAYLRTLRADAQLVARTADSVLAGELVAIARNQLSAGTGIRLDVTRAEAQLSATRAQLIVARNERDRARLDLRRALGLPISATVRLADTLAGPSPLDSPIGEQEALERALALRADLRAADEQLSAAERRVAAIRAERLPALLAFADDGATGKSVDHLLNTYNWGLQLSLPLLDGFRREGRIAEEQAITRGLSIRRRDLRDQAAIEVRGALLDLDSGREQVDAARERLRLTQQELDQARERFRSGVAGNGDVVIASLNLNGARNLVIDAMTTYQAARVNLARSMGSVIELP
ncbi:MAG: hypothetical protein NVS1B4_19250 [Gemmatimonadaceae bacterium]